MFHLLVLATLGASYSLILAVPVRSGLQEVTTCRKSLADLHENLFSNEISMPCYSVPESISELLQQCRPSQPVHMLVALKVLLTDLGSGPIACNDLAKPSPLLISDCSGSIKCLRQALNGDLPKLFDCASDSFRGATMNDTLGCLAKNPCPISEMMSYVIQKTGDQLCSSGPMCITEYGVFETVPNSTCREWTWLDTATAQSYNFVAPGGTTFQTDRCGIFEDTGSICYN
ncbi:uncharacterized protein [Watersipora subatra]|uniref:uncharacterized protein n=1 Tax=Watersipora subatra TaxID=2589382 RepID=UPI00355B64DE